MAMMKIVRKPPPNEPQEWVEVLTAEPTRRSALVIEASALGMSLLFFSIIFAAAVIVIQPFLLIFYDTVYPNLATVSFTSVSLAAGWLGLIIAVFALRRRYRSIMQVIMVFVIGLAFVITVYFFALIFSEFIHWLLYPDGLERIIHAWQVFFQTLF
jgi:hypothetical protein